MVLRVALDRQRPALDRVGEDHGRPVVLHLAVGLDQLGRGRGRRGRGRPRAARRRRARRRARPARGCGPGRRSRSSCGSARSRRWYSSFGISSMRRRSASPPGALEQALEPAAVLDGDHLPAGRLEHPGEAAERDVGHHAVERLAVQVHHPEHLAEARDPGVGDRLPDGALVELGVAEQRDLAAARRRVEAVVLEVAARHGAPDRRGGADADGAGGVVDRVGVLRPARVALQPAEGPQRLEVGPLEAAEQVVDGVQHRRGVRLHRDAVLGAQLGEPERRHQAHHRGARRLVAAHLHPGAVLAHAVGVVDDRGGEPEHPPLDGLECLEVRRRGLLRRLARGPGTSQHERSSHPGP